MMMQLRLVNVCFLLMYFYWRFRSFHTLSFLFTGEAGWY